MDPCMRARHGLGMHECGLKWTPPFPRGGGRVPPLHPPFAFYFRGWLSHSKMALERPNLVTSSCTAPSWRKNAELKSETSRAPSLCQSKHFTVWVKCCNRVKKALSIAKYINWNECLTTYFVTVFNVWVFGNSVDCWCNELPNFGH